MHKKVFKVLIFLIMIVSISAADGKKVFETYCWGCHHQSAMAFGPSFTEIASKRSGEEIMAMIADPKAVSKVFGYKRNAMPKIEMKIEEMEAITKYILTYKEKK